MTCYLSFQRRTCAIDIELVGQKSVASNLRVPSDFFGSSGCRQDERILHCHAKYQLAKCLERHADFIFESKALPSEFFGGIAPAADGMQM